MRILLASIALGALAATAVAQQPQQKPAQATNGKAWVAPGTPGSPIKGELFHAQILMSAHGFSPGVIDGKEGESFKLALRSFQEARGLERTGKLDNATRKALLEADRPSTVMVKLGPDDVGGQFVYPFPKNPEQQAELKFLGYRNMLEKVAERYHTTPATVVALNGPDKLIGLGQTLRLPNVVPQSRDYAGVPNGGGALVMRSSTSTAPAQGDYVVVDKSEGVLKVYRGDLPKGPRWRQQADGWSPQFPVTMGSKQYPLPIGRWKATTYSFLPPFNYQPEMLENPKTDKEVKLPPGPNGPVGVAWLDLTKEHYGIHGTNEPQTIGRAESSGCIRMTNWDVLRLSQDDEARLHRDLPGLDRSACSGSSPRPSDGDRDQRLLDLLVQHRAARTADGKVTASGREGEGRPEGKPPVTIAEGVGRAGRPRHPVAGREAGPTGGHLHPGARPAARGTMRDRHHGAEGTPVVAAADGTVEKLFFSRRRRRDHRLRPLARHALDLLLRPLAGLCARPCRGPAGQARAGDRTRRPHRQRQSRRAAPSFRDQPDAAGREMVPGQRRSIPTRCLPGKGPAAKARHFGPRGGSFISLNR